MEFPANKISGELKYVLTDSHSALINGLKVVFHNHKLLPF